MITVPAVPAFWGMLYADQWTLTPAGAEFVSWLGEQDDPDADRLRAGIEGHDSRLVLDADLPGWLEKHATARTARYPET